MKNIYHIDNALSVIRAESYASADMPKNPEQVLRRTGELEYTIALRGTDGVLRSRRIRWELVWDDEAMRFETSE